MKRRIVSTKEERQWQGIPAIERAPNGRLWSSFFSGGPKEPDSENYILLTTSQDDGVTWSRPEIMVKAPGPTRAYDPGLWHDPSGKLWFIYNLTNPVTHEFSIWAMTTTESEKPKPAWSKPFQIDLPAPYLVHLNKPTVLSTGEWLMPVTWAEAAPDGWFAHNNQLQGVALSSDSGKNWSFHGGVKSPPWALENMVVELRDGRIWMLTRTGGGVLWQSFSTDRGRTWSEGEPSPFVNPGVRFFIRRLASGRILLINTPDPKERRGLKAYLSDPGDEMRFVGGLELDARNQVSYPDAVQAPNGLIYAIHDCDRQGKGEILLDIISEDEILACRRD
jgi:sialidase-1